MKKVVEHTTLCKKQENCCRNIFEFLKKGNFWPRDKLITAWHPNAKNAQAFYATGAETRQIIQY
jgi:hypothetical protein